MTTTRRLPDLYGFLLAGLIGLTMLAIIIGRAPYLHDFAEWLYQGQIVKQFIVNPASVSGFTLAAYPVPNSLVTMILAALSFVFAPLWAGKVFLVLMLLAWYGVIRVFCKRFVDPQWRGAVALFLFACNALAPFFWYGFVSYQTALLLLAWFFAIYRPETRSSVIAFFGLAIFFAHAIVFLVFGLYLGVRLLLGWNRAVVMGLLPATACSLWFLVGRHYARVVPQRIDADWSGLREALIYKAGYPAMLGPFKNFLWPDGSSLLENLGWIYWPGLLVNFAVAAVLGLLVLRVLWGYYRAHLTGSMEPSLLRKAWALCMVSIMVFYLFAPYHFFGLVNAGGRVMLPLLLMAFMLGGRLVIPFVRAAIWPVVLFAFITSGSYFYLLLQSGQPGFSPLAATGIKTRPTNSVLDFNAQLYASTRYKYFNYRIFSFARRFEQIETGDFQGLALRNGMLIRYVPDNG
jgi:hypothetical protein